MEFDTHGKPRLAGDHRLRFNLSGSHGLGLLGVTLDRPIGVDVEYQDTAFEWAPVAVRYFTHQERLFMAGLPAVDRCRGFYQIWTAKESCLKCSGEGLMTSPQLVQVDLPGETSSTADKSWHIRCVNHHPDYAAAWAVREQAGPVTEWEWKPGLGPATV
jgi:4'-phosphopantetheinyl transferase